MTSQSLTVKYFAAKQLQWVLLLRAVLYSFLLAINFFLQSKAETITMPYPLALLLLGAVYSSSIYYGKNLENFTIIPQRFILGQVSFDILFASILIYFTGASYSTFSSVFFFPIIAGALLLPGIRSLAPAAAATFSYTIILLLEAIGIVPAYFYHFSLFTSKTAITMLNQFSTHGLTFFLAGSLNMLLALRLQKTETALSDSEETLESLSHLYKQIFDNVSTGIITINPRGSITSANNSSLKILGKKAAQVSGKNIFTVLPEIDLTPGKQRKSFDYPMGENLLRIGYSAMFLENSTDAEKSREEKDKIITFRDITEVERLEKQLRQAEKLAAIGTMSASIAHEFRNPLTAISGSAQILEEDLINQAGETTISYELCAIILRESDRLLETISNFLIFAKPEHSEYNWFSLKKCVKEILASNRTNPLWPESCLIEVKIEQQLDLWADKNQIQTTLNHLLDNALCFCPRGKEKIRIEAHEYSIGAGKFVQINIGDNGTGVASAEMRKIFEPFYTTRADGTGLGLSIVHQYVSAHKGRVAVGKSPLGGAEFQVSLPLPEPPE
ncbi:two-component system sensor histidine kinase NtrB [Desulfotalea psychrophila]|uniref:histidine kinase n=1 Tax=Desulfotalea psychrophila (strain LSv54 / DSM 12343) TaxID=177439 RepID=Q6AJM9_DESPS|nr:ATP-binding protein [Desulfotalea psychrophila]CAG37451.1 related to two-component system sensor histidine kinase (Ntr family) [Desulfotalea psychrophila LSv54]